MASVQLKLSLATHGTARAQASQAWFQQPRFLNHCVSHLLSIVITYIYTYIYIHMIHMILYDIMANLLSFLAGLTIQTIQTASFACISGIESPFLLTQSGNATNSKRFFLHVKLGPLSFRGTTALALSASLPHGDNSDFRCQNAFLHRCTNRNYKGT